MPYKWPSDPPGKKASHSITWAQHQKNVNSQGFIDTYNKANPNTPYGSPAWTAAMGNGLGPFGSNAQSAPPFDAELEAKRIAAEKRRTDLLSDQQVDLKQTSQEYGFKYDPSTGKFGGFDPTNPFSQAALLMKSRKERDQGENTGFASSGQLYSGAYQAAKQETGVQYNKGYDTLRRGFDDYVKNYLRRRRDIQTVSIDELANL